MIRGFDAAHPYAGEVDFERAARGGAAFAILKASEGTEYVNPRFFDWLTACRKSGMQPGAYHFAVAGDPVAQALHFVGSVVRWSGVIPAIDLEQPDGYPVWPADSLGWAIDCWREIKTLIGAVPLCYSNQDFILTHNLASLPRETNAGLWLAAWQDADPTPVGEWPFVAFWQQATNVRLPGVQNPTQLDFFNGSLDRLPLYGAK